MVHMHVLTFFALVSSVGWGFLTFSSASLLIPNSAAAFDRLVYGLSIFEANSFRNLILRIKILSHVVANYTVLLPLASFLWIADEVFFGGYSDIAIRKPVITISVPRGGTTSFHRTLALDDRFATPCAVQLVMPFISVYKLLHGFQKLAPQFVKRVESVLKRINRVTPTVEARHPVSLFAPDADDILIGEWHWVAVGSVRTFPVPQYWVKHYQMNNHSSQERRRSMQLHRRVCQKVLYCNCGGVANSTDDNNHPRLLLRSHLSPCVADFEELYPDAVFVGILRDPVQVLESFAGLSTEVILAATGVNMLAPGPSGDASPWPPLFQTILADMMARESQLYGGKTHDSSSSSSRRKSDSHFVKFPDFKSKPEETISELYERMQLSFTPQFQQAVRGGLSLHETYKVRHKYTNPSLKDMDLEESKFLELSGVARYQQLLDS